MKKFIISEDLVKTIRQALGAYAKHASKCSYVGVETEEYIEKVFHDFDTGLCLMSEKEK